MIGLGLRRFFPVVGYSACSVVIIVLAQIPARAAGLTIEDRDRNKGLMGINGDRFILCGISIREK
jgi:hypothetical protein